MTEIIKGREDEVNLENSKLMKREINEKVTEQRRTEKIEYKKGDIYKKKKKKGSHLTERKDALEDVKKMLRNR